MKNMTRPVRRGLIMQGSSYFKFFVLIWAVLLTLTPVAWGQEVEWMRQFGVLGPATDNVRGVDVDASGNVYVAVTTSGTIPGQTSPGSFIRKYDANGTEVWTRQFGTSIGDEAHGIAVDATGVYVAGGTYDAISGQIPKDAIVRKYDANGAEIWVRQFGTPSDDIANSILIDATGIYLVGTTLGTLPGQTSAGGGYDAFVRKYDANGAEIWTRQFGTGLDDKAQGISVDVTGVYVTLITGGNLLVRKYDANGTVVWIRQFGSVPNQGWGIAIDATGVYVARTQGSCPYFMCSSSVRKYDMNGAEVWARQAGTSGRNTAFNVSVDATGVYVVGGTTGNFSGENSAGSWDAYVLKYDVNGNQIWGRQFGTPNLDLAFGIFVGATGVYVTGTVDAPPAPDQMAGLPIPVAFMCKYDANGTAAWTRRFDSRAPADDFVRTIDTYGNIYVAGNTGGTFPSQTNAGGWDAFVRKYDTKGIAVWTRQFGSATSDEVYGIAVDASGVYVAGRTWGTLPGQTRPGSYDAFVRKYDANGTEAWTHQFGTANLDYVYGISVNATGVYVAGYTTGIFPGQTNAGSWDAFVRKYDTNGTEVWTRQFGSSTSDEVYGIAVDATSVYVVGRTGGAFPGQTNAGSYDAFVRKYTVNGNEAWTRQFGTSTGDAARGISIDATGVYIAGNTSGAFQGQTSAGNQDVFVRKYDTNGTEVWTHQFGTSSWDQAYGISVGGKNVYVAGTTDGTLPGQISIGNGDAFVRKYNVNGNEIWTWQFGTSSQDEAWGIAVDATGLYVAGSTKGALLGQASAGRDDAFVVKLTIPLSEAIESLISIVESLQLGNLEDPLIAKLRNALKSLDKDPPTPAIGPLQAFIQQVEAKRGTEISESDADMLIALAQAIINSLTAGTVPKSANLAENIKAPESFRLFQNYPNPFNPETEIRFQLAEASPVMVKIFNTLGVELHTLVDAPYEAGDYRVRWDGRDKNGNPVASGVYLYKLQTKNFSRVGKMSLLR